MTSPLYDVVAVGNAIVDVIQTVPDAFLEREGIAKSAMTLIDEARAAAHHRPEALERQGRLEGIRVAPRVAC